jgi:hypothetical protein
MSRSRFTSMRAPTFLTALIATGAIAAGSATANEFKVEGVGIPANTAVRFDGTNFSNLPNFLEISKGGVRYQVWCYSSHYFGDLKPGGELSGWAVYFGGSCSVSEIINRVGVLRACTVSSFTMSYNGKDTAKAEIELVGNMAGNGGLNNVIAIFELASCGTLNGTYEIAGTELCMFPWYEVEERLHNWLCLTGGSTLKLLGAATDAKLFTFFALGTFAAGAPWKKWGSS